MTPLRNQFGVPQYPEHDARRLFVLLSAIDLLERVADIRLILYDWDLGHGKGGLMGLIALRQMRPAVPLVVVSGTGEPAVQIAALHAGAASFLSKAATPQQVREHIAQHLGPAPPAAPAPAGAAPAAVVGLTPRQMDVLQLMGQGLGNRQIAHRLQISYATTRAHVSAVLHPLGARNRTEAVVIARRLGLLPP